MPAEGAGRPEATMTLANVELSRRRLLAVVMTAAPLTTGCAGLRPRQGGSVVLKAVGTGLQWAGRPFQALGANVWQLQDYYCRGAEPFTANGITWHTSDPGAPADGTHVLERAAAYGLHAVRFIAGGWNPAWLHFWQTNPEAWWHGHDQMMTAAEQAGIHLIPSLAWHALPFSVVTGQSNASVFISGTAANKLMVTFIQQYVSRYRKSPAVLMWELGNEWNLATGRGPVDKRDFANTEQLAQAFADLVDVIRAVDPEHLVTSGSAAPPYGTGPGEGRTLAEVAKAFVAVNRHVDVACLHVYPTAEFLARAGISVSVYLQTMAKAAQDDLGKPLMVGEFGESYVQHPGATFVRNVLDTWSAGAFPIALVWSWMAAPSSGASQLDSSVDPALRPQIADLFRTYAFRHPWPPVK